MVGLFVSFRVQGNHLPTDSIREDETFEENVQVQVDARISFLQANAKRRLERAFRAQSRPLQEFQIGGPVYHCWWALVWSGRVLCHEKFSDAHDHGTPGSVVWISHAVRLSRCSPEQLRYVTRDFKCLDDQVAVDGARLFHDMLAQVSQQQRYLDIINRHVPGRTDGCKSLGRK